MTDGESPIKEVVDATVPIADVAVREAWPARKVLIAVLPPTIALFSVCVGVWANANQDREARKVEFEKIRTAEEEAERNRVAEAEMIQDTAAKERRLREAELALPAYTDLLDHVHDTMKEVADCQKILNDFLNAPPFTLEPDVDGTAKDLPLGYEIAVKVNPSTLQSFPVPEDLYVACREIEPTIDELNRSLDKAQLVTKDEEVRDAADALAAELEGLSDRAEDLLARVDPVAYTVQLTGCDEGGPPVCADGSFPEYRFDDGYRAEYLLWDLDRQLGKIEPASKLLIEAARGVVLEPEE